MPKESQTLHLFAQHRLLGPLQVILNRRKDANVYIDINARDAYSRTPLFCAAKEGYEVIVRLLLEEGADLDARHYRLYTPLTVAFETRHEEVIKVLLQHGADINAKIPSETALTKAAYAGSLSVVKLLLKFGADVNTKDQHGRPLLLWSAYKDREPVARILLENDADVNAKDVYGLTPLSWAAQNGNEALVELLINKGADVNAKDMFRHTPLLKATRAAQHGIDIVKLLLENGAVFEEGYSVSQRVLKRLAASGQEDMIRLLRQSSRGGMDGGLRDDDASSTGEEETE